MVVMAASRPMITGLIQIMLLLQDEKNIYISAQTELLSFTTKMYKLGFS